MNKRDKNKNKGFTLIELLVVILIIAVLASIVIAQYQKSILKSRFSTLVPIAKALNDGQEMFLLSHGKYADKLENLDVEIAANASGSTATINGNIITLGANKRHTYIKVTKENFDNNLIMFQQESRYFPGEIHCEAKTGKILANWLCKVALSGKEVSGANAGRSLTAGYTDYVINGIENGFFPIDWFDVSGTSVARRLELSNGDTCTGTEDWECNKVKISDGACYAQSYYACRDNIFVNSTCDSIIGGSCVFGSYTDSSCVSNGGWENCTDSSFLNSTCEADKGSGCWRGKYKNSTCTGSAYGGVCHRSTFDNSECYGNASRACSGSTFKNNSICYANKEYACGDYNDNGSIIPSTYEDNACCKGEFCPDYAPKCDCGIDASTGQHALSC